MTFQTHFTHKSSPPEKNSGITIVERAGYISAQKRIENMILAGQRLVEYRKQQFDFDGNEIDEDFQDPTRNPNFDMADASQMQIALQERFKQAKKKPVEPLEEPITKGSQAAPDQPGAV